MVNQFFRHNTMRFTNLNWTVLGAFSSQTKQITHWIFNKLINYDDDPLREIMTHSLSI